MRVGVKVGKGSTQYHRATRIRNKRRIAAYVATTGNRDWFSSRVANHEDGIRDSKLT